MDLDGGDGEEGCQGSCDRNEQVDLETPTPVGDLHPPKGVLVYASEAVAGYNSPAAMVYLKSTLNKDLMLSEPPNASTVMRASTDQ